MAPTYTLVRAATIVFKESFTVSTRTRPAQLIFAVIALSCYSENELSWSGPSIYKGRPLVKMMIIVTTKGYIISTLGPYYSDSKNNDSMMTKHIFYNNRKQVRLWLQDGDVFVTDRGFRDCIPALEQFGCKTYMPALLPKFKRQFMTEEANKTRLATAVRWVIETRNGQMKQFRFFDRIVPNSLLAFVGSAFNLVCAILNRYHSLCIIDTSNNVDLARRMRKLVNEINRIKTYAATAKNDLLKNTDLQWLDASDAIQDFPKLSLGDLTQMNIGTYQIKQSKSYVLEYMNDDGSFRVRVANDRADMIRASVQSHHSNNNNHDVWMQYSRTNISGWYCTCKDGG